MTKRHFPGGRKGYIITGFLMLVWLVAAPERALSQSETRRLVPKDEQQIQLSFAPIVKRVSAGVVNIYAKRLSRRRLSPFFDDPFFRHFFGEGQTRRRPDQVERSLGSGVIVRTDGLVVTNHHVIAGAEDIQVVLADKRAFGADVVLRDERTDLAVLKIRGEAEAEAPVFSSVPLVADSEGLQVGDLVLAIGNPFGVGQTVTSGIVSALARTQVGISDYQFFIQTDAAINPGNSGGALIDMNGHLVGINTAIFTRSGGSNGIGFAIPANMVRRIIESAAAGGGVKRAWLGASLQAITPDMRAALSLSRPIGAIVTRVFESGPADRAGLRVGDVILALDGKTIDDPQSFTYRFATRAIGATAEITVLRNNQQRALTIELVPPLETVPRQMVDLSGPTPFRGAVVVNLSPAVADELSLAYDLTGVAIVKVARRSRAARLGLKRGDIIRTIDDTQITDTATIKSLTSQRRRLWRFTIERDGRLISTMVSG